jgi:hypothetical protein
MPLTEFNSTTATPVTQSDITSDISGIEDSTTYKEQISKKFNTAHNATNPKYDKLIQIMHEKVTIDYSSFAPHINGYYYIQMVHGSWVNTAQTLKSTTAETETEVISSYEKDYITNNDTSTFNKGHFNKVAKDFGQLATDIDIPQLNIEYESISGKSRNLNYASKLHFAGDFSINYIDDYNNHIFRYHESWFKYIDALKKGYIKPDIPENVDKKYFIDVPYFNAVWVVIFAPFTTNIRGLVKIMGVSPINLPFKQIIGDRGKNAISTINQSYKSNDMVYKFYDSDADRKGPLFDEFIEDMSKAHSLDNN